jgi:hypothetical protein
MDRVEKAVADAHANRVVRQPEIAKLADPDHAPLPRGALGHANVDFLC